MYDAFVGIDPGAFGAMSAIIPDRGRTTVSYMSVEFKQDSLNGYLDALKQLDSNGFTPKVIVESVHAMPGQGVTSMFSFGQRFGEIIGMLKTLGLGYELVPPKKWQKELGAIKPTESKADRKKLIAEKVIEIYPTTSVLIKGIKGGYKDGVADAFGLAHFAYKHYK